MKQSFEQATCMAAEASQSELKSVNHLGTSLLKRFRWLGDIEDINKCINLLESAVYRCSDNEPLKRRLLNNLATSLLDRFGQFGDVIDFNNAVHHLLEARSLLPIERLNDTVIDGNIGTLLIHRMELVGELADIQDALRIYDSTAKADTATDVYRIYAIHDQSLALLHRYRRMGDGADIDKAITSLEGVLHLPSVTRAEKSSLINMLGITFSQRFVKLQNKDDLDRCIASHESAVELLPDLHPSKSLLHFNLGRWLPVRFETARHQKDIDRAIISLWFAAKALTGPIRWKFRAASLCAYWIRHFNLSSSLDSFTLAMDLLPQLSWIGLSVANRHIQLLEAGEVVVDAVASAIEASQYDTALGWLEQGRSVVWAQLLELRKPVDKLMQQCPDLAKRFQEISRLLEGNLDLLKQNFGTKITIESHDKYHDLADERRQLIDKIRSEEGFSDFLQPTLFKELKGIAKLAGGFIVTVNLSQYRTDALTLMPGSDAIVHISLPNFTLIQATQMHKTLRNLLRMKNAIRGDNRGGGPTFKHRSAVDPELVFETILAQLWENVAKPVLDGIGLTVRFDSANQVIF
jgi:tetratricopeptide (TPR) repeat protein